MALTKCKECGKEISSKAEECPHCGIKIPHTSGCAIVALGALGLIAVFALSSIFTRSTTAPPPVAESPKPPTPPKEPPKPPTAKDIAKAKADTAARQAAEKKIAAMSDNNFCVEVGRNIRAKEQRQPYTEVLMQRAGSRYDIVAFDYSHISKRELRVGMSWCALFASWGLPQHSNSSTNAGGTRHQMVYGNRRYAYINNNILTSWQE